MGRFSYVQVMRLLNLPQRTSSILVLPLVAVGLVVGLATAFVGSIAYLTIALAWVTLDYFRPHDKNRRKRSVYRCH